tara:strand:+ start:21546 stop:22013 length:468 start_codon:yes stop_codon:yes gene_type:complete
MSDTIEEYINKLRENTASNMIKKREKKMKEEEQRKMLLNESMNNIEQFIIRECKDRMMNASNYGHFYTDILEFTNFDMFDENFKFVYLIKGPVKSSMRNRINNTPSGLDHFREMGVVPVMDTLHTLMEPIKFSVRYNRLSRSHTIVANWYSLNHT